MSALFPLPAILFLCTLVVVLIVLVVVYFVFLKKGKCCNPAEGTEEGADVGLLPPEDGAASGGDGAPKNSEDVEKGGKAGATENGGASTVEDGGGSGGGAGGGAGGGDGGGGGEVAPPSASGGEDLVDALPEPVEKPPIPTGASVSGTPLTSRPPPPTESHVPKEETASVVAGGSVAAGSAANADVGFIEVEEKEQICLAGKVLVSFTYMPAANKVNLKIIRTQDLPSVERGGSENIQIHLCVLPQRKQRYRTKMQSSTQGVFNQVFQFEHMTKDLLEKCAIRIRVYGVQRFSRKLMGEVKVPLSKIDLTSPLADGDIWMNLAPKGLVAQFLAIDEEDEPDDIDDWALE